jgi:hypothetical protein
MFQSKRKRRWARLLAGVAAVKAMPKSPLVGIAALLGGGYIMYVMMGRNAGAQHRQHGMQAA